MPLNLLGLHMDAERSTENGKVTIAVKRRPEGLGHCPHCGGELAPNGTRKVTYADIPVHGKPAFIEWDRQRFLCKACGKTSADVHEGLHQQFLMTTRLYNWIGDRSLRHTFASVADDIGLDPRTIRRVFAEWSPGKLAEMNFATPRVLGMDEIHLLRSARGVLTNIEERTIIDLLPGRSRDVMGRRLQVMPDKQRVEVVTMDMWRPYRQLAEALFPKAGIIIDKWHVLRMANEAMEKIRKGFRADMKPAARRQLMHDRYLLAKRDKDIKGLDRVVLEGWINEFPPLGAAWVAKEAFYGIYEQTTRKAAQKAYVAWQRSLTDEMKVAYRPLITAMGNWSGPVFNYFDHGRLTNAYTESLNRLIADANRLGRGYIFDVLRTRILLSRGALKEEGLPAGTFGRKDGPQVFTGIHIPTLSKMIEHGEF